LIQRIRRSAGFRLRRYAGIWDKQWLEGQLNKLGLAHAGKIHSYTTPAELETLFRLAGSCPPGSQAIEIGSYLGASTCFIAAALHPINGRLVCVDTWQNETMPDGATDTFSEFSRNVAPVSSLIRKIRRRSSDLAAIDLPTAMAFAFIDGDHSYETVRLEASVLDPLMAGDGTIVFHDALYFCGVSRVIGELLVTGRWKLFGQVENLVWLKKQGFDK
jgi:predicted O-methyltransferase YrrM